MNLPCNQPGVNDGDVRAFVSRANGLDLKSQSFSVANALALAVYSKLAYTEPPTIQDKNSDTQVLIRDCGDYVVVAFRGTSSLRDFVTDAQCWKHVTAYGGMHAGFYNAYYCVKEPLYQALRKYSFKPVILTGHSLGGALAMLAAYYLRLAMVNVHSVYTFGAPRVGNAEFQNEYNSLPVPGSPFANLGEATFTLIHDCDIVPRIPAWLAGWHRPGRDEFIDVRGKIVEEPSIPRRLFSDLLSLFEGWQAKHGWLAFDEVLIDHRVDNYIAALKEIAPLNTEVPA